MKSLTLLPTMHVSQINVWARFLERPLGAAATNASSSQSETPPTKKKITMFPPQAAAKLAKVVRGVPFVARVNVTHALAGRTPADATP